MRVFVAGATGAIGRPLIPQLLEAGHEVTALARTPAKARVLEEQGVETALADALTRPVCARRWSGRVRKS
jgi:2-alkyl-3-oxoalkanoate reductase